MNLTLCLLALYTDTSHCNTIFEIQTWWKPLIAVHYCTCIPWWRKGCHWTGDIFPPVGAGRMAPQIGTSSNLPQILLHCENLSEIVGASQLEVSKSTHHISNFWSLSPAIFLTFQWKSITILHIYMEPIAKIAPFKMVLVKKAYHRLIDDRGKTDLRHQSVGVA